MYKLRDWLHGHALHSVVGALVQGEVLLQLEDLPLTTITLQLLSMHSHQLPQNLIQVGLQACKEAQA